MFAAAGPGELGNGNTTEVHAPAPNGVTGVKGLAMTTSHALALRADDTVGSWGANDLGQLGNTTTSSATSPTTVVATTEV